MTIPRRIRAAKHIERKNKERGKRFQYRELYEPPDEEVEIAEKVRRERKQVSYKGTPL
jgi:hypothetical protein